MSATPALPRNYLAICGLCPYILGMDERNETERDRDEALLRAAVSAAREYVQASQAWDKCRMAMASALNDAEYEKASGRIVGLDDNRRLSYRAMVAALDAAP